MTNVFQRGSNHQPEILPSTTSYCTACAKYFPVRLCTAKLAQSTSQYYFVLQSSHKILPSTTSNYKACTKYFPVLLRTTKLAQTTAQYYFVLQSSHKVLSRTKLYYAACTKYFPVLLRTTKLAQSTSQYYFIVPSLHKVLSSTTSDCTACTKYFPVILRTTRLAQSTSQYYFVLQSPHKVLSSTTSYYQACTKYFPVQLRIQSLHKYFPELFRTTKLAQNTSQYYFVLQSLLNVLRGTNSSYKACTKYFPLLLRSAKLAQSTSQYNFVLQSSHKVLSSTTSYCKARTKYFPVLLRTTKLAQSTSQQSLHKVLPSTTSYYKACTKYFPVLLRTAKLAQSTSQYYFVLQSLHKVLPTITSYCKACTKYFPVLLRTTKLAQSTSQYYFVLQSSHKVLPSTTSYYQACTKYFPVQLRIQSPHKVLSSTTSFYKACTKYFPVQLRSTKLAQSTSQYYFVLQSLHKVLPSSTLYYTACTKYFPVLLRFAKLAQSTSQYYFIGPSLHIVLRGTTSDCTACTKYFPQYYFVLQSLHKVLPSKTCPSTTLSSNFKHLQIWKTKLSCEASFQFQELKRWKRSFGARPPSNSKSWKGESEALVQDFLPIPRVEKAKAKLWCKTSFHFQELKMWNRSFGARRPSNSKSWRCETEALVRGVLPIPRVEEVKAKLWCKTSFQFQELKMWNRSFGARRPSNSESWRCETEALVRGVLPIPRVEDVKPKLWCKTSFQFQELKMWNRSFGARRPSNSKSWRGESEALVRGVLPIPRVEEVKAKLWCEASYQFRELKMWNRSFWCEASFQFQELKMWNRSFGARRPSNSKSWRCETEALVRGVLPIPRVEEVKAKLWCKTSFQFQELKMWNRSFGARLSFPIPRVEDVKPKLWCEASFQFRELKMWNRSFGARRPSNSKSWRCETEALVRGVLPIPRVEEVKAKLWCKTSFQYQELKRWKRSFGARLPSNSKSWRCETEALVRGVLPISRVEEVKAKLWCEASFQFQELKMWNRSFGARRPSNSKSWRGESEALVQDFLPIPRVEEVKAKLWCEASFQFRELKRWNRSFGARRPSNSKSWRCETEALVRGVLPIPRVEEVKPKLWCEASFQFQELKMWNRSFGARRPSNSKSWRYETEALVRGVLQIPRVQEVNTYLQCSSSNSQSVSTHAKHNSTASSKKRKSHLEPSVPLRAQFENISTLRRRRPKPSRKQANFSPQRKLHLPEINRNVSLKSQHSNRIHDSWKRSFRARLPSNSKSWRCETEAFVRGFLQIRLYSTLLYSTLLNSSLLCSAQLYSAQLYSTLVYPTLLNSIQHYSTLLCSTQLYSTLLYSTLLDSTLLTW